jgi:signal peptidase II
LKRVPFITLSLVVIILDALTKLWITSTFALNESRSVIPDFFQIIHVRNPGAAFGIGANSGSAFVPMLLNAGAIGVLVLVGVYSFRAAISDRVLQTGLHLILGGAVGNLVDRFRFGSVVDFLDFYVRVGGQAHHWPAFNVADSAICIGIGLLFLDMRRKTDHKPSAATDPA